MSTLLTECVLLSSSIEMLAKAHTAASLKSTPTVVIVVVRLQSLYIHQMHFGLVVILKCGKLLFGYKWRVDTPNFYCTLRGFLLQPKVEYFFESVQKKFNISNF